MTGGGHREFAMASGEMTDAECFPVRAAFPKNLRRVGVRNFTFEACSGLTRVTARIAQSPKAAFIAKLQPTGCPTSPLASYQTNRQLSGWNLPPLVIRAVAAH